MSLLLLLGGAVSPPSPASSWDVTFVLFDAAHAQRWPVFPIDASIGHDGAMIGQASLTFPGGDDAPSIFMGSTLGQEFPEVTCRAYCRGTRIWTGVGVTVRLNSNTPNGTVEIVFEHSYGHFLRRRQIFNSSLNSVDTTDQADDAILITQKAQIGATPTIPAGHPGTRTDMGSFTVTVATGGGAGASTRILEQSGNNLLDVTLDVVQAEDLAVEFTDGETGTFIMGMTYPFEKQDLTDLVIFNQYHGNLASFEFVSDRASLVNVWGVSGKTAGGSAWDSDAPSIALWGEYEGFAQLPQDTNDSAAMTKAALDLKHRHAAAKLTYKATIIETIGHQFITDFGWRDSVRIYDAVWGLNITGAVKTWAMRVSNGRMHELDIGLGEPRPGDITRDIVGRAGLPGPRMLGDKWNNRRQA